MDHNNVTSPASTSLASTISQLGDLKGVLQPIWASVSSSTKWGEVRLSDFFFFLTEGDHLGFYFSWR